MKTKHDIKETILSYKNILNNEYLDKYVELIYNNIDTKKQKFKTQAHHFIPVSYYKDKYNISNRYEIMNLVNSDKNNFTINLLYKDHVLAHYYLALCSQGKFKYQNENAIFHVLGNINYIKDINYINDYNLITSLDKYQELYEDMARTRSENYKGRHCKPNTEKHKQQISAKNKGVVYVRKFVDNDYIVKKTHSIEEFNSYINQGWEKGNYPRSMCKTHVPGAKNQGDSIRIRKKGKIAITDGYRTKYIDKKDIDLYIGSGWKKGKAKNDHRKK